MIGELVKPVLTILVAWLLNFALNAIGYQIDLAVFDGLVAAIVTWMLGEIGFAQFRAALFAKYPKRFMPR